jgi:hypothetical protein
MPTFCRAFDTEDDARSAVGRLMAAGAEDVGVRVIAGTPVRDHAAAAVGSFAGHAGERVGAFAGQAGTPGSFAGHPGGRRGSFGDLDRETVTAYEDGLLRVHVAAHGELGRMLVEAGLDEAAAAADVEALHRGRVLVLVRASAITHRDAAAVLDQD